MLACMNTTSEPELAAPGAGLPKLELLIGRLLFAVRWRTGNRAVFGAKFSKERQAIRKLVSGVDSESAARRVLIRRLRGMEDSSRYWSAWMTLEHLRIVNLAIAGTIKALARGDTPERAASTAAVKPSPAVDGGVVAEYESACDHLLKTAANVEDLKTKFRYAHPWFGPLNAFQWFAMAGGHMAIHRGQLQCICTAVRINR